MSEADYQRGLRGGDCPSHDSKRFQDWLDGRDARDRAAQARESAQDARETQEWLQTLTPAERTAHFEAKTATKASAAARAQLDQARGTWVLRGRYLAFALVVAALWWGVRQYSIWLPSAHPQFIGATLEVLSRYVGATLGATIMCIGFACLVPRFHRPFIASIVLVLLFARELSPFAYAQWIENIRATWLGGMVLGDGFRWSRLLCYAIGTLPLIDENDVTGFWRLLLTVLFSGVCVALWHFARQFSGAQIAFGVFLVLVVVGIIGKVADW